MGIDKYTLSGATTLTGCETDANNMASLLTDKGGWSSANVTKLVNSYATRTSILNALGTFSGKAVSGDSVIFYQSSHGGTGVLCACNENISATELGTALRKFVSGVKVVCIIDACHSASLANKDGTASVWDPAQFVGAVSDTIDLLNEKERSTGVRIASSEIGWCTAAASEQTSLSGSTSEGGVYSYPLIMGARTGAADVSSDYGVHYSAGDGDGTCTASEAFWYAYNQIRHYASIGNAGDESDSSQHIPQIFNESVCDTVVLNAKTAIVPFATAANASLSVSDNCVYEMEEGYYCCGGWFGQSAVSADGASALRSAPILPQRSCELDLQFTGPGTLSFKWKVSCPSGKAYLTYYPDDDTTKAVSITGTSGGWSDVSYTFSTSGTHKFSIEFFRTDDGDIVAGDECGYLDCFKWTAGGADAIASALDCTYLTFTQGANPSTATGWKTATSTSSSISGGSCLACSGLNIGTNCYVSTTVSGPCVVDWDWACLDSQGIMGVFVDDEVADYTTSSSISSSQVVLSEGTHTLIWVYIQNGARTSSSAQALLDWVSVYYPVSFNANGGSGSVTMPETYTYTSSSGDTYYYEVGSSITLPSGSGLSNSSGLTFQGWIYNGSTYEAESNFIMPLGTVEFKASWGSSGGDTFLLSYSSAGLFQGKGTYAGYVLEGDNSTWASGAVIGTATIKTSKMKGGSSPITLALTLKGQNSPVKLKGTTGWSSQYMNLATATLAGNGCVVRLNITQKNIWGYITCGGNSYFLDSARQDDSRIAARINAAKGNYKVACFSYPYSGATKLGESFVGVSAQVGNKGKTKMTGVLPDLSKLSGSTYVVADDKGAYLPFFTQINTRKGSFGGFLIGLSNVQPVLNADGLWDGTGSKTPLKAVLGFEASEKTGTAPHTTWYQFEAFGTIPKPYDGSSIVLSEFPGWNELEYFTFAGKTWTQRLADYKKMKLTFAPKTGLVKGKFTFLLANGKKPKATVNGIFISKHNNFVDGLVPCSISVKGKMTLYGILQ